MGVLNCDRTGCENIMCDRYSDQFGYICWECFEELCNVKIPIEEFMNSDKAKRILSPYTKQYYDIVFPTKKER